MDIVHDKEKAKFRVEVDGVTAYVAYSTCRRSVGHSATIVPRNRRAWHCGLPRLRLRMIMPVENGYKPVATCSRVNVVWPATAS